MLLVDGRKAACGGDRWLAGEEVLLQLPSCGMRGWMLFPRNFALSSFQGFQRALTELLLPSALFHLPQARKQDRLRCSAPAKSQYLTNSLCLKRRCCASF